MSNLRECLVEICSKWNGQKVQPFSGNNLASFIRNDFADSVRAVLPGGDREYIVKASPGNGNWAAVPWLSILDPDVSKRTTDGFYVVYLFRADGSGVYLSFNQGTTGPTEELGSDKARLLWEGNKRRFRNAIPELSEQAESIELRSHTQLGASYEPSNIGAKFYPSDSIPALDVLKSDLNLFLEIFQKAKSLGVIQGDSAMSVTNSDGSSLVIAKPFLILAGPSGTGKSRWVRQQAFQTWAGSEKPIPPANYLLVPVKPNWHDSSDLLGYVTRLGLKEGRKARYVVTEFVKFLVRAWKTAHSPHWLCLDEMNLAPVEQYFAEYLSVVETRRTDAIIVGENGPEDVGKHKPKIVTDPIIPATAFDDLLEAGEQDTPEWLDFCRDVGLSLGNDLDKKLAKAFRTKGISLPQNLIVVGTVNMDETTHSFSRKVLDRAFVWEMPIGDLDEGWDPLGYPAATPPEWKPLLATGGNEARDFLPKKFSDIPDSWLGTEDTAKALVAWLKKVNEVLDGTPFNVSYRVRDELLLLALARGVTTVEALQKTLDDGLYSKILPRIEGDVVRTQKALAGLGKLLLDLAGLADAPEWSRIFPADSGQELDFQKLSKAPSGPKFMFDSESWPADPFALALPWRRSLNKIRSMLLKLESQFTSYWD